MRVLMITPVVDLGDSAFGFVHIWINELARRVSEHIVITLRKGKADLRENVKTFSSSSVQGIFRPLEVNLVLIDYSGCANIVFM